MPDSELIFRVVYFHSFPKAAHTFVPPDRNDDTDDLVNSCSIDSLQVSLAFGAGEYDLDPDLRFSLSHVVDDYALKLNKFIADKQPFVLKVYYLIRKVSPTEEISRLAEISELLFKLTNILSGSPMGSSARS